MGRRNDELESLRIGYRNSVDIGDSEAASQWANQLGNYYKDKGSYVEAQKWFQRDYDIVTGRKTSGEKFSPREIMTTCQCLGEVHRRLNHYEEALNYQMKHYELACTEGNLVEQQRASTQLGSTYLDLYEKDDDLKDFIKARDYYETALNLSKELFHCSSNRESSFVLELVDSYNNMGTLKLLTENWREAKKYFLKALKICEDEELGSKSAARSRVHHNLGRLLLDQSSEEDSFKIAKEHMQTDIKICKEIPHLEGEAKGYINLGRLYLRQQLHDEAMQCFVSALNIAKSLEDEDALVDDCKVNIKAVNVTKERAADLQRKIQDLKKLQRESNKSKKHLCDEYKALYDVFKEAEELEDFSRCLGFAKEMKRVARKIQDSEKIGDAYNELGIAYNGLRKAEKARKWAFKAIDMHKRTKHAEGEAVALINYGNALDAAGDENGAFQAFQEAYSLARSKGETKMLDQQENALNNIQYIYSRREDINGAIETQQKLDVLKRLKEENGNGEAHCSDSDEKEGPTPIDLDSDPPQPEPKKKKRQRVVILDDDDDEEVGVGASESTAGLNPSMNSVDSSKRPKPAASGSYKSVHSNNDAAERPQESADASHGNPAGSGRNNAESSTSTLPVSECLVPVNIGGFIINLKLNRSEHPTAGSILETLMQLYQNAKPEGPHPVLKGLKIMEKEMTAVSDVCEELSKAKADLVEAIVAGWREVPLLERYKLQCHKCSCFPNSALLRKMEMAKEGEIDGRDCELDGTTAWPLLLALGSNDILSSINLAHNRLESSTINAFQDILSETKDKDIGLELDYHDNKLGASSLCKISACQTTLARLEVLILSRNELTDRVGHNLASVVRAAHRLQVLELEGCKLGTSSFQDLGAALESQSHLARLSIGNNRPGHALKPLLEKLSTLPRFTSLDISDVEANSMGIEGLVLLIRTSNTLSELVMKGNPLRDESWKSLGVAFSQKASQLTKVDLTDCKIRCDVTFSVCKPLILSPTISSLSLAGNHLDCQVSQVLQQVIAFGNSPLKALDLSAVGISHATICHIVAATRGSYVLEELKLARNASSDSFGEMLVTKLSQATSLKSLDLSNNGLVDAALVEELFKAWSLNRGSPTKHFEGGVLHFSIEGVDCCKARPCCTK